MNLMDFRVYVIVEIPLIERKYELLVPIDRRIHDLIFLLKNNIPELSLDYYKDRLPYLYNKNSGQLYSMNLIIKDSNIKMGTRLVLI